VNPALAPLVALVLLTPSALREGGREGDAPSAKSADERRVDERAFETASRALEWLATQQNEDGSFSVERDGRDVTQAPVAVTALSALAFMAHGSTLGRGPYREHVASAIEFLLARQRAWSFPRVASDGTPTSEAGIYLSDVTDTTSKLHGHGYATLALAQAYGTYRIDKSYGEEAVTKARSDLARIREALVGAVRLIELSQDGTGGWLYEPGQPGHEGSVTIALIQALRAARDIGVHVDRGCIERAVKYVHESQDPVSGGFRYARHSNQITYALTAAAIATLNATGDYDSSVIDRGIGYMEMRDPVTNPGASRDDHPFYARFYAAQTYYVYRDPAFWRQWYPALVDEYEAKQGGKGAIGGSEYGRVYSTASACLVLLLPLQYLPAYQR
jgi:hypothetical protein